MGLLIFAVCVIFLGQMDVTKAGKMLMEEITPDDIPADCFEYGVGYPGGDFAKFEDIQTPEECRQLCVKDQRCEVFTLDAKQRCRLKTEGLSRRPFKAKGRVSGFRKNCVQIKKKESLTNCMVSANTIFNGDFTRCPSDTFVTGYQHFLNPSPKVTDQYCCDPSSGTITTDKCAQTVGIVSGEAFCPTGKLPNNLCNTKLSSYACYSAKYKINLTCCDFYLDGNKVTPTSTCRWVDGQVGDLLTCGPNELVFGHKGTADMSTPNAPVGTVGIYCCTYNVAAAQ